MDDASAVLLLSGVHWYLKKLIEIGKLFSIIINFKKTKILTNIIEKSLLQFDIPQEDRESLSSALALLHNGKEIKGLTIVAS
eukprot:24479-Ditylum_brightwellii.AAC.2